MTTSENIIEHPDVMLLLAATAFLTPAFDLPRQVLDPIANPVETRTVEIANGVHVKFKHPDHMLNNSKPITNHLWITIQPPAKPSRKAIIHYGRCRNHLPARHQPSTQ